MSNRLQLDVRNLSLGRRHLVNAYEVKAGIGVIAGTTVFHAWAPCVYYKKWVLYKYTYIRRIVTAYFCALEILLLTYLLTYV